MAGLGHGSDRGSTPGHSLPAFAKVYVMRSCLSSRSPAKYYINRLIYCTNRDICCTVSRIGLSCLDRYVQEADLTETILGQEASPVAVSCEPDVFCSHTTEINSGIVCIVCCTRPLGKLGSCTQCRIVGAVG